MKIEVIRATPAVDKIVLEASPEELVLIHATLGCTNGDTTAGRVDAGRYTTPSAINSRVSARVHGVISNVLRDLGLFR